MRPLKRDQVKDPSSSKGLLLVVQLVDLGLRQLVELEMEEKKEVVEVVEEVEMEVMEVVEEEEGHMRRMTRNKKRFVLLPFIQFLNVVQHLLRLSMHVYATDLLFSLLYLHHNHKLISFAHLGFHQRNTRIQAL